MPRKRLLATLGLTDRASLHQGEAHLIPPAEISLDADQLLATARAFGLQGKTVVKSPSSGIINTIYLVDDDFVIRVPRDHPGHFQQTREKPRSSRRS